MTCAYGVENVGVVLITYGICDAFFSSAFGHAINYVGRMPIFLLGAAINFAVMAVLFTWPPNPDQGYVFFVMAGLWGVADAVWQTQINGNMLKKNVFNCFWIIFVFSCLNEALYGSLFEGKEEAGFSNYRMWESIGFMIAYMLQNNVRKTMRI